VARETAARLEALQLELESATARAEREAELRRRLEGSLERRDAQLRREVEDAAARRDAEHQARVQALEAEAAALRDQNRRVADCIKGDKDAKMQVNTPFRSGKSSLFPSWPRAPNHLAHNSSKYLE